MNKAKEIQEELQIVFSRQGIKFIDSLVPLALFLVLNLVLELRQAFIIAISVGIIIILFRLVMRAELRSALIGIMAVVLGTGFVLFSGSSSGIVIPGLISGVITILLCLGSVIFRKPLAAWTSYLTRRWPLEWYWHTQVRPAYTEVTLIWAAVFALRAVLEYSLSVGTSISMIGFVKIALGWPYTILVLIVSYIYGTWRLGRLKGPSVEEFISGAAAPWEGQRRGF